MGIFKKLIDELQDKDSKTSKQLDTLIDDMQQNEPQNYKMDVVEEFVFGYMVFYQYAKTKQALKDGGFSTIVDIEIIDVIRPLDRKSVTPDTATLSQIIQKLKIKHSS